MRVCQFRHFGLGNAPDYYSAQMKGGNFSIVKIPVLLSIHLHIESHIEPTLSTLILGLSDAKKGADRESPRSPTTRKN
jgi:hypothetical protein